MWTSGSYRCQSFLRYYQCNYSWLLLLVVVFVLLLLLMLLLLLFWCYSQMFFSSIVLKAESCCRSTAMDASIFRSLASLSISGGLVWFLFGFVEFCFSMFSLSMSMFQCMFVFVFVYVCVCVSMCVFVCVWVWRTGVLVWHLTGRSVQH